MKRIVYIAILLLTFSRIHAQDNLPMVDYKTVHFGFTLGLNFMDFGFEQSGLPIDGKMYNADMSWLMPGFSVGVIGDVRICEYLSFRLVPAFHLSDRNIYYSNDVDDNILTCSVRTTSISVPGYFKFNGPRIRNYRPYLLCGGGVSFDLGRDRQRPILMKTVDYFIEFGVGCTAYLKYFRLSPEIKFMLGFNNVLEPWENRLHDPIEDFDEVSKYTLAISRLTSRMLTLCVNFE